MKSLVQRVTHASVTVNGQTIGEISNGMLVLLGVERGDDENSVKKMADKLVNYRIFSDTEGKMNLNVKEVEGSILLVSQFTLVADTHKGLRPGFSKAAAPELADSLYQLLTTELKLREVPTETGQFAADMQVSLVNDGPVTFLLEI